MRSLYPEQIQAQHLEHHEDRPESRGRALCEPEDAGVHRRVIHLEVVRLEVPRLLLIFRFGRALRVQILFRGNVVRRPPAQADQASAGQVLGHPEVQTATQKDSDEYGHA